LALKGGVWEGNQQRKGCLGDLDEKSSQLFHHGPAPGNEPISMKREKWKKKNFQKKKNGTAQSQSIKNNNQGRSHHGANQKEGGGPLEGETVFDLAK